MDATRRRTRDRTRQGWYARHRSVRFARRLGFPLAAPALKPEGPPGGPPRLRRAGRRTAPLSTGGPSF
jgi:hypothetical protein